MEAQVIVIKGGLPDGFKFLFLSSFIDAYQRLDSSALGIGEKINVFLEKAALAEAESAKAKPNSFYSFSIFSNASDPTELLACLTAEVKHDGVVYLSQLAVDPLHKRTGLGRTLVDFACKHFATLPKRCVTRRVNQVSQSFFVSMGFSVDETWTHPDYASERYVSYLLSPES